MRLYEGAVLLHRLDLPDDEPFRIDRVDARRHHRVADHDIRRFRHVIHPQPLVAAADDHPLRPRSLDDDAGRRIAIDQQLDLGGTSTRHRHPPDHAGGRDHRHISRHAIVSALVDRDGTEIRRRRAGDDLGRGGFQRRLIAQLEQTLEPAAAVGLRALPLQIDQRRVELPLQRRRSPREMTKIDVAGPDPADARGAGRHDALDFGHDAERRRFEQRHAGARVHLGRDEQDVTEHHRDEQVTGALSKVQDGHY